MNCVKRKPWLPHSVSCVTSARDDELEREISLHRLDVFAEGCNFVVFQKTNRVMPVAPRAESQTHAQQQPYVSRTWIRWLIAECFVFFCDFVCVVLARLQHATSGNSGLCVPDKWSVNNLKAVTSVQGLTLMCVGCGGWWVMGDGGGGWRRCSAFFHCVYSDILKGTVYIL